MNIFNKKNLILDGAMGTVLQKCSIDIEDFCGTNNCFEVLNLTNENIIKNIHRKYIESGADIIETNTFNCNKFTLEGSLLEKKIYEICKKGGEIAREIVQEYDKKIFIAGSIGPTGISVSQDKTRYMELEESYREQISGLLDGGIDFLLIETVYDFLNLEIAIKVCKEIFKEKREETPIVVSFTCDNEGRIYSGEKIEDIIKRIDYNLILGYGLNCVGFNKTVEKLRKFTDKIVFFYPNQSFFNEEKIDAKQYFNFLIKNNLVDVIGGCCGTDFNYIKELNCILKTYNCNKIVK